VTSTLRRPIRATTVQDQQPDFPIHCALCRVWNRPNVKHPAKCKLGLQSQNLCIDAFGVGEEIWVENSGLYHEKAGNGLQEGWVCIFTFLLFICIFLCHKAKFHAPKLMETYELLIISFLLLSTLFWGYYFINVFVAILAVPAVCLSLRLVMFSNTQKLKLNSINNIGKRVPIFKIDKRIPKFKIGRTMTSVPVGSKLHQLYGMARSCFSIACLMRVIYIFTLFTLDIHDLPQPLARTNPQ